MRKSLVAVVALCACGGGGIPYESLSAEFIKALCKKYAECGAVSSEDACTAAYSGSASTLPNPAEAGISSGKIKYDGSRARACLDGIVKGACSDVLLASDESCRTYYEGQVKLGEACTSVLECVPDAYCARSSGATCSGVCAQRIAEGADASAGAQCMAGLVVINGKCQKPAAAGAACDGFASCEPGLFCGSAKVCQKYRAEGETCDSAQTCASLLTCKDGKCVRYIGAGQSCANSGGGSSATCQIDLYCEPSARVCALRVASGATCNSSDACKDNLRCSGTVGAMTCAAPVGEGGSCASGASCDNATYCEVPSLTCKRRLADGENCTQAGSCGVYSSCTQGKCQPFTCP